MHPPPIETIPLFAGERAALLSLLRNLAPDDWNAPTVCDGWNVHDVALHVLSGDVGWLSSGRDAFHGTSTSAPPPDLESPEALARWTDERNNSWVESTRRMSPPLVIDLLAHTGDRLAAWLPTLDLLASTIPVSWVGPEPAPMWLHVAREYAERWVHQQHIRDATGRPGLTDPEWLHPVLTTFARARPFALRHVEPAETQTVSLQVLGPAGGVWAAEYRDRTWRLMPQSPEPPDTSVTMDEDTAWRAFTRGLTHEQVRQRTIVHGDPAIGEALTRMVTIIA